ncbi:RNA polymerase sigma-70 factor [Sinomicrobium oceani]|uniref:RNA polymerase sigma-70 factor n=1 Tax=Sinomicrobium oceani TaxID=1150368 RepID=UPI00227D144E|nr:RNA polymerase sigma-70 factor [Sinomicrobium oceani]
MHAKENSREVALVKELTKHSEAAFRRLFEMYSHEVFAYGKSILRYDVYAEEMVQDVFLKIWLNRATLNPELSFRSYIFTITRNLAINFLHRAANDHKLRREIFYGRQEVYNQGENRMDDAYYKKIELLAIAKLPPKRRRIFELSRKEGKSYEEISNELGISVSTVKNQMSSALETIRNFLFSHGDVTFIIVFLLFGLS